MNRTRFGIKIQDLQIATSMAYIIYVKLSLYHPKTTETGPLKKKEKPVPSQLEALSWRLILTLGGDLVDL